MGETVAEAMRRVKDSVDLRQWCEGNLTPYGSTFVCPSCDSGEGPNHTPAFAIGAGKWSQKWTCHSCKKHGDVFDLEAIVHGTATRGEQVDAVAAWAGVQGYSQDDGRGTAYGWGDTVTTDGRVPEGRVSQPGGETEPSPSREAQTGSRAVEGTVPNAGNETDLEAGRQREREYVLECRGRIDHPDAVAYLSSRGIDLETARAWGLGYDPNAGGAKREDGSWCRRGRIVIPWRGSTYYHVDRSIAPDVSSGKYSKPRTAEVGKQPVWNPDGIKAATYFVVEGPLDALAVEACGFEAVALGSTRSEDVVEAIKGTTGAGVAVLMLDNDEAKGDGRRPGQDAQAELAAQLGAAGVEYMEAHLEEIGHKDAMEAWEADPQFLEDALESWRDLAIEEHEKRRADRYATALSRLHVVDAAKLADELTEYRNPVEPIPTGFSTLDAVLGGGLMPKSVYVMGGGTSMGKTTITHQIGDFIAEAGERHVLFVSIEQRGSELVAKSLSRLVSTMKAEDGRTHPATVRDLTICKDRMRWGQDMSNRMALESARAHYNERIAPRIHFVEAQDQPDMRQIRTIAETMAERDGVAPVVMIDYLQLIASSNPRETDEKQVLKRNMVALRQLAGTLDTPVFVLAALSRSGANKPMETDSFRDSSNIEYSSDVLLGIQLRNFRKRLEAAMAKEKKNEAYLAGVWTDEEKAKTREGKARQLEVVVIKNRAGETMNGMDGGVYVDFEARYSYFTAAGGTVGW